MLSKTSPSFFPHERVQIPNGETPLFQRKCGMSESITGNKVVIFPELRKTITQTFPCPSFPLPKNLPSGNSRGRKKKKKKNTGHPTMRNQGS